MKESAEAATGTGLTIHSDSPEETERLGATIGAALVPGDDVRLSGEMGAGKTTLARGITIGARCEILARSPTFVIVSEYPGPVPIAHCDLYRIGSPTEVSELALEERLAHGALLVEWPENGAGSLQPEALTIELTQCESQSGRRIQLSAVGDQAQALLARVRHGLDARAAAGNLSVAATEAHVRAPVPTHGDAGD